MKVEDYMIRLSRNSDMVQLIDMIRCTIDAAYSGVYPGRAVQFFKEYHSEGNILQRGQAGEILIAEKTATIIATGALVDNEILGVFVRQDSHKQGFGKAIMSELEGRAKKRGFPEVIPSVSLPSKKFYEILGYEMLAESHMDVGERKRLNYWSGRKILIS